MDVETPDNNTSVKYYVFLTIFKQYLKVLISYSLLHHVNISLIILV